MPNFFDKILYNVTMSDNIKRLRAISKALKDLYPGEPKGNLLRHLFTLAAIISGIIGSRSTNLPLVASKAPDNCKVESRAKRFSRWINNEKINFSLYFLPFTQALFRRVGRANSRPANGRQHSRTRLHYTDGQRSLQKAGIAYSLAGSGRKERPSARIAPSGPTGASSRDCAKRQQCRFSRRWGV